MRKGGVVFNGEGEDVRILRNEGILLFDPLEIHSLKAITEVNLIVVKINN